MKHAPLRGAREAVVNASRAREDTATATTAGSKRPFDVDVALGRIDEAVQPFAKAAMFELADDGFTSVFEQLVACMISIRTRDETTLPTARRLFARARTPAEMAE